MNENRYFTELAFSTQEKIQSSQNVPSKQTHMRCIRVIFMACLYRCVTDSCSEYCTINNSKILTHLIISQTSKYFLQEIKFVRANFLPRLVPGKKCRITIEMLFYISCSNLS